jgi:CheY-like chemotaxis protein
MVIATMLDSRVRGNDVNDSDLAVALEERAVEAITVLVVDDDPEVCWAMDRVLTGEGYRVVTASSGEDALAKLDLSSFSIILVDAKLPGIEGGELARRIRHALPCPPPMILVSGYFYADDPSVCEALRVGLFQDLITKPFLHEELRRAIRKALSSGAASSYREAAPERSGAS